MGQRWVGSAGGSNYQVGHCLGVNHEWSCWLRAVPVVWGGSFGSGMLCPRGLLLELTDKMERTYSIRKFGVKMEVVEALVQGLAVGQMVKASLNPAVVFVILYF